MKRNTRILSDRNIKAYENLVTAAEVKRMLPISQKAANTVLECRSSIEDVLDGKDDRKILYVGPCSVHDLIGMRKYALPFAELCRKVVDRFILVTRTYLEKPRSEGDSWEGYISDPHLDNSMDFNYGLYSARELLLCLNDIGVPTATELLDVVIPQYYDDLLSWASIGARNADSSIHRRLASGMSMPIGFKNSVSGDIVAAAKAAKAATYSRTYIGSNPDNIASICKSNGNPYVHVVLRGGNGVPNYTPDMVQKAAGIMKSEGLRPNLIIDCSHGNSNKQWEKQLDVFDNVYNQICEGSPYIVGMMVESYHDDGKQDLCENPSDLKPGLSITDGCVGWEKTERKILDAYNRI